MTGDPPTAVEAELEGLCYGGESLVDAVTVTGGTVGVTTHRVLALTPDGEGPTLRAVERPNVAEVAVSTGGDPESGARALRFGAYAIVLLGASLFVNFDTVAAVDVPSGTGAGQVVDTAVALTGLLTLVDDALRAVGVVVLLVALGFLAHYGYRWDRHLAVEVDGGDALTVPVAPSERRAADRVAAAVEKASNASDG